MRSSEYELLSGLNGWILVQMGLFKKGHRKTEQKDELWVRMELFLRMIEAKKLCRYLKRRGIIFIDQAQDYYTKMLAKVRDVEKGKEN